MMSPPLKNPTRTASCTILMSCPNACCLRLLFGKHRNIFSKAYFTTMPHSQHGEVEAISFIRPGWRMMHLKCRQTGPADMRQKPKKIRRERRVLKRWTWGEAKNFWPLKKNTGMDKSSKPLLGILKKWLTVEYALVGLQFIERDMIVLFIEIFVLFLRDLARVLEVWMWDEL